jgi:hypothetical protein
MISATGNVTAIKIVFFDNGIIQKPLVAIKVINEGLKAWHSYRRAPA